MWKVTWTYTLLAYVLTAERRVPLFTIVRDPVLVQYTYSEMLFAKYIPNKWQATKISRQVCEIPPLRTDWCRNYIQVQAQGGEAK